jgi:hypothetical protein
MGLEQDDEIFLKTAFPSRKYKKRYGLKGDLLLPFFWQL